MAKGREKDLRLDESVLATLGALRKASGHSRGILVPGVCSDLLALPALIGSRVETPLCLQGIDSAQLGSLTCSLADLVSPC